jgi:CBS-domain-containing membrane protein
MQITNTTHPPAGATALLPATNQESWYFLPIVLLSSGLLLVVALINNNIQRHFPTFWIEPAKPQAVIPTTNPIVQSSESSRQSSKL